jgi:hypothetical protein
MSWRTDVNLARAHLLRLQGVMELIDAFARLQYVVLLPCLQRLHAFVFVCAVLAGVPRPNLEKQAKTLNVVRQCTTAH